MARLRFATVIELWYTNNEVTGTQSEPNDSVDVLWGSEIFARASKMRLVIDTNQADPIRQTYQAIRAKDRPVLVVPHMVWIELLYGRDADKRRATLLKFPLRFGMDMPEIFERLAGLGEDAIRDFVPVHRTGTGVHKRFLETFRRPTRPQLREADKIRSDNARFRQRMLNDLAALRKKHTDQHNAAKSRGEDLNFVHWKTIEDGTETLFFQQSEYRNWVVKKICTNEFGDQRLIAAKSNDSLFEAVWSNPVLRRWLRLQAVVSLGYANVWEDNALNRHIKLNNDDETDISLVLYARDGDTILTADKIKDRIRHIDIEKSIEVTTWNEWIAGRFVSL